MMKKTGDLETAEPKSLVISTDDGIVGGQSDPIAAEPLQTSASLASQQKRSNLSPSEYAKTDEVPPWEAWALIENLRKWAK